MGNVFNMAGGFWLRGLGFWGSEFRAVMGKKMEFIVLPIHRLYYPLDNIRSFVFFWILFCCCCLRVGGLVISARHWLGD